MLCSGEIEIVLLQISKHDSSYSLASIGSGSSFAAARVDEELERKEAIGITGDVQKFVGAISELRKAMEEADEGMEEDGGFLANCFSICDASNCTVLSL